MLNDRESAAKELFPVVQAWLRWREGQTWEELTEREQRDMMGLAGWILDRA